MRRLTRRHSRLVPATPGPRCGRPADDVRLEVAALSDARAVALQGIDVEARNYSACSGRPSRHVAAGVPLAAGDRCDVGVGYVVRADLVRHLRSRKGTGSRLSTPRVRIYRGRPPDGSRSEAPRYP